MFPYILFISLAALTQSILNTYKIFVPSAMTPILLNISIISIGFLLWTRLPDPAFALGIGVIAGGALQLFFPMFFLRKRGVRYRFSLGFKDPGVRRVVALMLPATIGAGVYQINTLVSEFIAATLEEGSVAALRFSNVLVEVVLGGFVISLATVMLPALSERSSKGDMGGMKESLSFALRIAFLITLPAAFGLFVLRHPIIRMLFRYGEFSEKSAQMVAYALAFHVIGLCGTGGARVVVQMFFSMKDTRTPVMVAGISMASNLLLCYYLSKPLKLGGIALAGALSVYIDFVLLTVILERRVGRIVDREIVVSFLKSLVSSALMAAALYSLLVTFDDAMAASRLSNAGLTILFLFVGAGLFFFFNLTLKNNDILRLKNLIAEKLGAKKIERR